MNWLGKVPQHWEVRRLKTFSQIRYGLGQPPREAPDGLPLVRATNVSQGQIVEEDMVYVDPTDVPTGRNAFLSEGEIIVVRSGAYTADSAIIPKRYSGAVTGYDMVVTVMEALPEFVAWAALAAYVRDDQLVVASLRAAQPHLNAEELGSACFFLPPLPEQQAIARFLDAADRRIRRYIRAKERLIELLEERKRVLIHEAVTGRIDVRTGQPYPAYKDSGIDWLGKVPEHWGVRKLRSLFRRHGSGTTPPEKEHFGGSVSWLMSGDLNDGKLDSTTRTVTRRAVSELPALKLYPPESLVVAMYGATIGRTGILSISACTNQACCVLADPFPDTSAPFVQAVLVSAREELVRSGVGGGQPNINAEVVRAFRVPSPPRSEQTAIAHFVDAADRGIQRHMSATRRQIALLREYRTRLIADVVTGKLDVREAADLPETEQLAGYCDRPETVPTESNLHPIKYDLAKEAIP